MKQPLTNHYCMVCDWEETTHKIRDGIKCPECGGPVRSKVVNEKEEPLLSLTMKDATSVPEVKLHGEEIEYVSNVAIDYATNDKTTISVSYWEKGMIKKTISFEREIGFQ